MLTSEGTVIAVFTQYVIEFLKDSTNGGGYSVCRSCRSDCIIGQSRPRTRSGDDQPHAMPCHANHVDHGTNELHSRSPGRGPGSGKAGGARRKGRDRADAAGGKFGPGDGRTVLHGLVARELDDELPGMFSRPVRGGALKLLCLSMLESASLKIALYRLSRFFRLILDDFSVELSQRGDLVRIALVPSESAPVIRSSPWRSSQGHPRRYFVAGPKKDGPGPG